MKRFVALVLSIVFCIGLIPAFSVSAEEATENIALGKPVVASSTMGGYDPNTVVDGNYRSYWARGKGLPNEYIMIDLGEAHRITSMLLHTRLDIDEDIYRTRMAVEFSNTPDFAVKERIVALGDEPTPYGVPVEIVPSKTPYRYVRVVKMDTSILVVAEIEVFGYVPDPNATELGADVVGSFCEGPVTLLSHLKTMENVNEEIFGIDHLMTRGEAATAVTRAIGKLDGSTGAVPFSDVPKDHKYYSGISAAYGLGYISGDGNSLFRPDDYVTERELVFMAMRAIGYSEKVVGNAEKLLQYSVKHDILKGVSSDEESGLISRGNAAVLIYNALLAPTIEMSISSNETSFVTGGMNTLYSAFGITLTKGVVLENDATRLDGEPKTNERAVNISGTKFVDKNGLLKNYLGRRVIVATDKSSGNEIVLAWPTYDEEIVEIKASQHLSTVADIQRRQIVAENEAGKERKYGLETILPVVINGYADPYWQPQDLMIDGGKLTLINNDSDSQYDVVFVDKYSLHYLAGAFGNEEDLTLVDSKGVRKTVKKKGLKVTDCNGKALSASKVKEDTLVRLYETVTGENTKIEVFNSPSTGKVTLKNDKEFEIDGVRYPVSLFYKENKPTPEPNLGVAVRYYLDENGEILWIEKDPEGNSDWTIAFSQMTGVDDEAFESTIKFKVFDIDGKWNIYEVADKVRVDGTTYNKAQLKTLIQTAKSSSNWQYEKAFIRYKLNANSEIREIDTIDGNDADSEETPNISLGGQITAGLYSKESSAFWENHKQLAVVNNDTPVFVIPTVGDQYTTDSSFDDLYGVAASVAGVAGDRTHKTQNIDYYMVDEKGNPTFMAKKEGYTASTGGLRSVSSDSAPNIVVKDVETEISDSEVTIKITGKDLSTHGDVTLYAEQDIQIIEAGLLYQEKYGTSCFGSRGIIQVGELILLTDGEKARYIKSISDIGYGDIIRYETILSKASAVERVFDYEETGLPSVTLTGTDEDPATWFAANGSYPDFYIAFNRFQLGNISSVTSDKITLTSLKGHTETYLKSSIPTVYVCTMGRTASIDETKDFHQFTDGNYKAVICSYNASPKTMVVYKY